MTDLVRAREPEWGERSAVTDARRWVILQLPEFTVFHAGWRVPSGSVQSQVFFRVGAGCGPTTRDADARRILTEAATYWPVWEGQVYGIEILAMADGNPIPRWQAAVTKALDAIDRIPWRDLPRDLRDLNAMLMLPGLGT